MVCNEPESLLFSEGFSAENMKSNKKLALTEQKNLLNTNLSLIRDLDNFYPFRIPNSLSPDWDFNSVWIGPKDYVTDFHTDDFDLFLFQIYGSKMIKLVSPEQDECLYPIPKAEISNKSIEAGLPERVITYSADYTKWSPIKSFGSEPPQDKYPLFQQARIMQVYMSPGDCIYIPKHWWHAVKALDFSIGANLLAISELVDWAEILKNQINIETFEEHTSNHNYV